MILLAVYALEILYFVPVLSIPLELEAITFKTVIKAMGFFSCCMRKHEKLSEGLKFNSYRLTHVFISIYHKAYLHKARGLCFQAIGSFHSSLMEECENETVGELFGNFCCVRELISV